MFEYLPYNVAPWGYEIPIYFFLIGTAAMVFVLAAAPAVFAGPAKAMVPFQKTGLGLSLILLAICSLLLIMDLGQPGRFLYPIIHFHWTSPLSWGALFLPAFGLCIVGFFYGLLKQDLKIQRITGILGSLLALSMPLYTGLDLMVHQGRELWANPTIPVLFVILSISSGAALAAVVQTATGGMSEDMTRLVRNILFFSLACTLALFLAQWVTLAYGSAEQQRALEIINAEFGMRFWLLTLIVGILVPLVLVVVPGLAGNAMLVTLAGILGAIGAYFFREVLLYAGQLTQLYY